MFTFTFLCYSLTILLTTSYALPSPPSNSLHHRLTPPLTTTTIHEFPKGTWLENLVIRQSDSNALVTLLSSPEVLLVSTTNEFKPITIATIPNALGCLGIVELYHDVFYIVVGNFNVKTGNSTPGTYSIWEIDLRNRHAKNAAVTKITDVPGSGFLNGMTVLNPVSGILAVADSLFGVVWVIDVRTGSVGVAINDTSMTPTPDGAIALGINGLRVVGSNLYYDNSNRATFNKIPIDLRTGHATGPAVKLFQGSSADILPDDFAIDFEGNAWAVTDGRMFLLPGAAAVGTKSSSLEFVAGSATETKVTGFTSTRFGTRQADVEKGILYVTSDGGPLAYRTGNFTAGGMLLKIETAKLGLY